MLQALRRFVQVRLGVASRDDGGQQEDDRAQRGAARKAVEKNILRLAKRLDRMDKQIDTLTQYVARLDAIAQTGRLRKSWVRVDALVRNTFLNGQLRSRRRWRGVFAGCRSMRRTASPSRSSSGRRRHAPIRRDRRRRGTAAIPGSGQGTWMDRVDGRHRSAGWRRCSASRPPGRRRWAGDAREH